MSGHLICRDNPNGNLVGGLGRTRGSFASCILIFCRFDPRHVSIRDRSNRTWSMFARHEEVDLHAPNFQSRAFVIAFLAPTRWKGRSTFASTGLRLRSWLRRYKGRRHRERERERERERKKESREGAGDEVTRPCAIPTIRLIIIPNRFANAATRATEFHRFLRILLLLPLLFRVASFCTSTFSRSYLL